MPETVCGKPVFGCGKAALTEGNASGAPGMPFPVENMGTDRSAAERSGLGGKAAAYGFRAAPVSRPDPCVCAAEVLMHCAKPHADRREALK